MRYLQCVNNNLAIFHGLLNPKNKPRPIKRGEHSQGQYSCQTHAYEISNFLCIETDFIFYWQRVAVILITKKKEKDATQGSRANIANEDLPHNERPVARVRTFMKIERVAKHFIHLEAQGQEYPQGAAKGKRRYPSTSCCSCPTRSREGGTSCFLSIIEIAILPF